jgi:hypothetical protein
VGEIVENLESALELFGEIQESLKVKHYLTANRNITSVEIVSMLNCICTNYDIRK